jgi:phage gp37-like protein
MGTARQKEAVLVSNRQQRSRARPRLAALHSHELASVSVYSQPQ